MTAEGASRIAFTPPRERGIGRQVAAAVRGQTSEGEGGSFRPRPGLPTKDQLEYVQQLATVVLLLLALGVFTYYLARYPRKAVDMALARVGMKP